ncbi:MAG: transglutaminase domain-containing protein [Neobacillus sp.]
MIKRDYSSFLLYAFGFLLLWEWLRPIEQLTTTDHIETFVIFLVISFAAAFFKLKWIWQFILKLGFIFFSINQFHYQDGFFQVTWLKTFLQDMSDNFRMIFARNWLELSNEFRTLLFFILLWLMVYLIHYWMLNRQKIFIFFLMTIIYITVLDTFTVYSAKAAIVRTVMAGFAVMGMLTYYRILSQENVNKESSVTRKWMRPLAIMIVLSVIVGIAAPKAEPIWPDPVPYLKASGKKEGTGESTGTKKIGYGTNDSNLGGPFVGDDRVVFETEVNAKTYWKVETKDIYTGKGWIATNSSEYTVSGNDFIPLGSIPENVESLTETAFLSMRMNYKHLVYPAGIQRYQFKDDYFLNIDAAKEKITFAEDWGANVAPPSYKIDYKVPKYKASDLILTTSAAQVDSVFMDRYTQLPEELPERIRALAEEITSGKTNWFDKARTIESYFSRSEYIYDQKDVAIPGENQDYVDQFLFDTKIGYCDNFSTSMVVMLRTLGIPARWVKGYTGGEFKQSSKENPSLQIYEITNNNAHSWVEVYFPNQGWVPFEPTKGFTNDVSINFLSEDGVPVSAGTTPPPVVKPELEPREEENPEKDESTSTSSGLEEFSQAVKLFMSENWGKVMFSILVLGGTGWFVYRVRGRWVPYFYLLRFRMRSKDENIGEAYHVLLNQLERYGLRRKENQTLRNYARYIDSFFSTREMTKLTARYEQFLYHQQVPDGGWNDTRELWENLIKKTIA